MLVARQTSGFASDFHNCYTHGVSFVSLGLNNIPVSLVSEPPSDVDAVLSVLIDSMTNTSLLPPSVTIPPLSHGTAIPLAAVLLEYPVAYVPTSLEHPFLSNITLDVYECVLLNVLEQNSSYTLLKFSCPSELAGQHTNMDPEHIIAFLTEKFTGRMNKLLPGASFQILHNIQTLDRVAL
ncbi:hypothetical protein H0H81_008896 [Sphagnurus paluster]|uniref:Uncharacterized protein n=1 Tax=Sphagnurus paluster TaxID=117069 RepID=A0A9P7FVT6_9AGAR|nr:hypothetical protein H0H81_008896 [Sphagnurus paluster]